MPELLVYLSAFRHITIVCHPNADPDCIGSAYALQTSINSTIPTSKVTIYAPDSVNTASHRLINYLKIEMSQEIPPETDVFLLVDTSSLDQVPAVKSHILNNGTPYVLLDHHFPDYQTMNNAAFTIVRETSSACEIVYEVLKKQTLTTAALDALLVGIIYDSRRFLIRPGQSIKVASKLIKRGAKAELAIDLLSTDQDPSEKMAKLKGAARTRIFRTPSWTFALTHVGAFEASVARALTDLGADLAFVINDSTEPIRLTGRSQDHFYNQTGLNLARDIMKPLAEEFSGQGGGHPTAASANLKTSTSKLLTRIFDLLAEKLHIQRGSIVEIDTKK
ncbi:MAG: DHH family phosphoesterase [Candidatus Methanomethyliaceae archaeon]|nr:DHH family phosphoesterase [Candidatus Methanomethyliaceae archaeon]